MDSSAATENPRSLRAGKVVFVDPDAAALLSGALGELGQPAGHGWEPVKHNVSRTVYRGKVGKEDVYLKHFHSRSLIHRVARRLGVFDAKREMRFSEYLSSRGVATADPLAWMCNGQVEWLVTRAVAPAESADVWHERQLARGAAGRGAVQKAIVALAEAVGRMHAAGVIHRDLHCANMLVRTDGPEPRVVLTDLHRARRRRRLSRRAKVANLAQLFHDRYDFTTRTERLRFLKHYLRFSGASGSLRGWQIMVEQFARRHTRRQRAQRDRRIFKRNRYFTPLKLPGHWRGHVVLASKRHMAGSRAAGMVFSPDDWREALSDPLRLLKSPDAQVIKDSRSGTVVRRRLQVGPHSVDVFIKRWRRKHPWKIILDCFRLSRSRRAFKLGHALLTRRIATALPLAALDRRVGPILLDSIFITEAADGLALNHFLNTWLAPADADAPLSAAQRSHLAREVLWELGRMLQRLHDSKFAHRDLKAINILVCWSPGTSPEIVLLDLDGIRIPRYMTVRRRFQGLMRLNVSLLNCPAVNRAGRMRILLGYLRRPGAATMDFKRYWRALEDWSARKLRRQIGSRRRRQRAARRPAE